MAETSETAAVETTVRYKKPKILTVDLPLSVPKRLRAAGYNVLPGTFGRPYRVKRGDGLVPVIPKASVPNYSEQEVVVIDLAPPETAEGPEAEKVTAPGELDWFAKASTGVIDPRPRVMTQLRSHSDRILKSGGVFVLFAQARIRQETVEAAISPDFIRPFRVSKNIEEDNWSLLSTLSPRHLQVQTDYGTEIKLDGGWRLLSTFLRRHLTNASFSATLHRLYPLTESGDGPIFFPLATSKFGEPVAGILVPRKKGDGFILILPQLEDKEAAVLDLIQNVLPEITPRLFPDHEGSRWVHRDEYEHSSVKERKAAQLEIQRNANEEIARLDKEIEAERESLGFLHGILTKSGEALVADVKRALEFIGFQKVVDVDGSGAAEANKQEDLQILDRSPSLLVEIKGLARMPTEGDTLQVTKYVLRRVREWDRTDVIGISLVNHQRNLPALERDHANAFTEQQVQDAAQYGTGLMTTWDLFRLIRGMVQWGWPAEAVRAVLYSKGRLPQIPSHYTRVGTVAHYWTKHTAASIDVAGNTLRLGDRIGYLFDDRFFEEEVTSLEVDGEPVQEVCPGQRVGMRTTLARRELPVGTVVYRVGQLPGGPHDPEGACGAR